MLLLLLMLELMLLDANVVLTLAYDCIQDPVEGR